MESLFCILRTNVHLNSIPKQELLPAGGAIDLEATEEDVGEEFKHLEKTQEPFEEASIQTEAKGTESSCGLCSSAHTPLQRNMWGVNQDQSYHGVGRGRQGNVRVTVVRARGGGVGRGQLRC